MKIIKTLTFIILLSNLAPAAYSDDLVYPLVDPKIGESRPVWWLEAWERNIIVEGTLYINLDEPRTAYFSEDDGKISKLFYCGSLLLKDVLYIPWEISAKDKTLYSRSDKKPIDVLVNVTESVEGRYQSIVFFKNNTGWQVRSDYGGKWHASNEVQFTDYFILSYNPALGSTKYVLVCPLGNGNKLQLLEIAKHHKSKDQMRGENVSEQK